MRIHLDKYYTPEWCTRALIDNTPNNWYSGRRILEPSAGTGQITRILQESNAIVDEYDIDPELDYSGNTNFMDFTSLENVRTLKKRYYDSVVMNPPYSHAAKFIDHARLCAPVVCALLRWTWLEPCGDRAEFLEMYPPNRVIVLPRPKFAGKGADQATSAWFIWEEGCSTTQLQILSPKTVTAYGRPYRKPKNSYSFVSM